MTFVDLSFPIIGDSVPQDHGHALYGAITTRLPVLHEVDWLGVHPIGGRATGDTILVGRGSAVRLRLPAEKIGAVLPLAGSRLNLRGAPIGLGAPTAHALRPSAALDARTVLLKLTNPPSRSSDTEGRDVLDNDEFAERYRTELARQLSTLEVIANLELCGRRTITIHKRRLIGYSVRLTGLDLDASLRVQERGLGGRRTLGCGLFRPTRGK